MKTPCMGCVPPERHIGCHATCAAYLAFAEERSAIRRERDEDRAVNAILVQNQKRYRDKRAKQQRSKGGTR